MTMNRSVFRKYDIRGVFQRDLDRNFTVRLGKALGEMAGGTAAVGRDCRNSGAQLMDWLSSGMLRSGCNVVDLGVQTTPMTYFAAHTLRPDVTVMITGSHNPPEYNGFKIMAGLNTLHGNSINDIRLRMEGMEISDRPADGAEISAISPRKAYLERLLGEFSLDRSLKVVVDAGNGTGGDPSVELLEMLGCRVVPLFCNMDGRFPNHHPDPTVEKNLDQLRKSVIREKADLGLAFDGDADRLGVIDDNGDIIWGDRLLIILARTLLKHNPGATIISEVKASRLFFDEVRRAGGRAVMSPTGHSLIKKAMTEENAMLAGEMSGHIFFRDRYYGYDDALYASLRLMEIIASDRKPLHSYLEGLPDLHTTPEIREDCRDEHKFQLVARVTRLLEDDGYEVNTIDGARITFPDGWGLVRASNTQPVLVMRFEAGTRASLADYEKTARNYIEKARREMDV
ncbi:MAG: phosphomannomutase/phosphoglucomutase [Candidatus Aegiribacteria sp.]